MRGLDVFYFVVEVGCFALAILFALAALHSFVVESRVVGALAERSEPVGDTYYFVRPFYTLLTLLIGAVVSLGVGGVLHWLRRLYETRRDTEV